MPVINYSTDYIKRFIHLRVLLSILVLLTSFMILSLFASFKLVVVT